MDTSAQCLTTAVEQYKAVLDDVNFLSRLYVYFVNHRIHNVPDPLTHTLVQMATSPIQLTFCESGLLGLRTTELPVFPFADMSADHKDALYGILAGVPDEYVHESAFTDGKLHVSVVVKPTIYIDRKQLLLSFVRAVQEKSNIPDASGVVQQRFCKIILQRFLSSVATSSAIISHVMGVIDQNAKDVGCDEQA